MKFRTPYDEDYDPEEYSTHNDEPSLTKQAMQDDCDINNIVARYERDGVLTHVTNMEAEYGFCDGMTFTEAMITVTKAQSMFMELPSELRERFENDPAKFLDYVDNIDAQNAQEAFELGLVSEADLEAYAAQAASEAPQAPDPGGDPPPENSPE